MASGSLDLRVINKLSNKIFWNFPIKDNAFHPFSVLKKDEKFQQLYINYVIFYTFVISVNGNNPLNLKENIAYILQIF